MYIIRPHRFDDSDFHAHLKIHHLLWPEYPFSMDEWRLPIERAAAHPKFFYHAFVVENEAGRIVATGFYGEQEQTYSPGTYWMDIRVHPDYQKHGIGSQAYAYIVSAAVARGTPPLRRLLAATRTDRPDSMRFLEQQGFTKELHTNATELRVMAFDGSVYAPLQAHLAQAGIHSVSAAELETQGRTAWRRELWELHQTLLADVPSVVPYVPIPFEEYESTILHHPSFHPSACFVALDGEQMVGMSYLHLHSQRPEALETAITGVIREYRRRGIATLLKVKGIEYAQQREVTTITTMNEEKNPMYRLNVQLGFKPLPSWITYQRLFENS